jgi:hypothetical protein
LWAIIGINPQARGKNSECACWNEPRKQTLWEGERLIKAEAIQVMDNVSAYMFFGDMFLINIQEDIIFQYIPISISPS